MKVQITVDLSDDELIGIGLIANGQFVKASRADAATWLSNTLAPALVAINRQVETTRKALVSALVLADVPADEPIEEAAPFA